MPVNFADDPNYLSVPEAAEYLGITRDALQKRIKRGTVPVTGSDDGTPYVRLEDLSDIPRPSVKPDGFYTTREAAEILQLSVTAIRSRVGRGTIPFRKGSNGETYFSKEVIDNLKNMAGQPQEVKPERPGYRIDGDTAVIVGPESMQFSRDLPTKDELREFYGFPENDWVENKAVINWWGDPENPRGQMKIWLSKRIRVEEILPARFPEKYKAPKINRKKGKGPKLWVVAGDAQVPHNDKAMEDCFLQFLREVQPDGLLDVGDQGDNPSVSSYSKNPKWHAEMNECIQATTHLNYHRRRACETMEMVVLASNHDTERIKNYVLNKAPALYGLERGQLPGEEEVDSVLAWSYLTRADDLNITVVGEDGDNYQHAEYVLSKGGDKVPGLVAEHGNKTGPNAKMKTVENVDSSRLFGHTHAFGVDVKVIYDVNKNPRFVYSINTGTFAKIKGGLGFTKNAQWVNCFVVVCLWPDGRWTYEQAKYEDGELLWRDMRWKSTIPHEV